MIRRRRRGLVEYIRLLDHCERVSMRVSLDKLHKTYAIAPRKPIVVKNGSYAPKQK